MKQFHTVLLTTLIALCFVLACMSESEEIGNPDIPTGDIYTTQLGFDVFIPTELFEHSLYFLNDEIVTNKNEIIEEVLAFVDYRFEEFAFNNKNLGTREELLRKVKNSMIILHDHFAFWCGGEARLCAGLFSNGVVHAALYQHWKGDALPDFLYPEHTYLTNQDLFEWSGNDPKWIDAPIHHLAIMFADNSGVGVLPHEWCHEVTGSSKHPIPGCDDRFGTGFGSTQRNIQFQFFNNTNCNTNQM